jgi:hypothetical protein
MAHIYGSIAGIVVVLFAAGCQPCDAGEYRVGAVTGSITPVQPVAVMGQFHLRVSQGVDNPLTATAVAIESREADRSADQTILISCDLALISPEVQQQVRDRLRQSIPDFDPRKLVLTATHTHTAPVLDDFWYVIPKQGVMQPSAYVQFLVERLGRLAEDAWKHRQPGGVSWALGHAVVGHNRRSVFADGTAAMYGRTDRPDFRNFESGEDHGLEMLFFWDRQQRPIAVAINTACPSQEVESRMTLNADFWHDVRQRLMARHKGLCVLGWPGACGDQRPCRRS